MRPRLRWPLLGAAVVALVLAPQVQASHLPGFGHDNAVVPPNGTGTTCNIDGSCLIAQNDFAGNSAVALHGVHFAAGGAGPAVLGETNSTAGSSFAVHGRVNPVAPGGFSAGVRGQNSGTGGLGTGVWGSHAGSGWAGYFTTSNFGIGVLASAGNGGDGVSASSAGGASLGYGVTASTGSTAANAAGVRGTISSAAANAAGVRGRNTASACCGMGVFGEHTGNGLGVYGESNNGFAVSGFSTNNFAGYFQGSVQVVGLLMKSGGSFKIDHPLDPENKYLSHSFVESPDMMNVYNGNVVTNAKGFATVKLPRYFSALNRDFRYQLTSLSGLMDVAVAKKIRNNRFTIQSEKPFAEVSWQVTGIRKDRWANANRIKVEEAKSGSEAGKYLNPELYGKPGAKSVVVLPGADSVSSALPERRPHQ